MKKILIQLDTSQHASSFDRVVAVDAGVDELMSYHEVTPVNVESLVHGAMFTRGPADLKNTALFIGGSDVHSGENLLRKVQETFFGPVRVSVMMDSNGSNTTAAAAVLAAGKHLDFAETKALILGGTGPVGLRAAQLLARRGASVVIASRSEERAQAACDAISALVEDAKVQPLSLKDHKQLEAANQDTSLIIAAGAAGVKLIPAACWKPLKALKVVIDLNAVPPAGIEDVDVMDKATERDGKLCYGAIGVGGTKMKIHKAAIRKLFEANDLVLDTEEIYQIGVDLQS
ncbi:NADP-dependent methylenetetrahydromethanopterin/methylenetetrahydrofolate dehydrogenase [Gimesia panareensis]|uniref:Bifunctional protein MdtA n=1 Tax=Gimesia panareensis TaxID=2527978 RepID=A0A517Q2G9_9PLAN|nr:NADP-dependent methylenetetrahydromethanopterin/methylenetetrahydrofolate dehydrogenase [Gimesia panareensis]QDT25824.1 Bifunctional protein MdtA [Gimesia panareensis]QDU48763.1 Bifunctional protein MdtA [Gimesia panareensis]